MSNHPFLFDRINRLKADVARFQYVIYAYETTDYSRYPENFEKLGLEVAMKAEAIACSTRDIVSTLPSIGKKRTLLAAADAQGIKIEKRPFGYEIVMPGLMTKRDDRSNVPFLLEPLSYALDEFARKEMIERYDKALIWFIYEYADDTPARHIRDYDNIESKEVLDMINAFFLLDDGGDFCQLHYSSCRGERDCTRIIISPDICLISCLDREENRHIFSAYV